MKLVALLLVLCVLSLAFPPIGALAGVVGLIVLIRRLRQKPIVRRPDRDERWAEIKARQVESREKGRERGQEWARKHYPAAAARNEARAARKKGET